MKVKVIKKRPPKKIGLKPFMIDDSYFWYCPRCEILYGKGETILEGERGKLCPIHTKEHLYCADLDYWRKEYELGGYIK